MRSADEIQKLIINTAKSDNRIRAVLLNGSRANPNIQPDKFQDFDIVFIVSNFDSFISDRSWTDFFGDKVICQLPDEMTYREGGKDNIETIGFHYLMLFKDGNRIDLTLFPIENFKTYFAFDSLTIVWLDKDNLFPNVPHSTDTDYHIQKPTEKIFLETCNEFWWVCTYVAKGLLRNEITYAKELLETTVRPVFMQIIEWFIGTETNFSISFGKGGKFMKQYLSSKKYDKILATYSDQHLENNWKSLFLMTELFGELAATIADRLNFQYNLDEQQNVMAYLKASYGGQE
ncbi:aminoglycoside 6-adenylyltransferase [Pontibacter toksunensis]|uniref:Aminoglycoside 6-adenylyltransferase n=1 Tax=Pontibacter toksunensis TaxID=1332631 RepID=A0ABW6BYC9_9BACT